MPPLHAFISKEVLQQITKACIASRVVDKDHGKVAADRFAVYVPFPWSKSTPLCGMYVDRFSSKNQIAMCNTYTHDGGDVWYPSPSELLMHWRPTKRFTCPSHGDPLFIRASCIHSINRCYNGSLVAFGTKEDIGWRLGIVCQLHYLDEGEGPDGDGSIGLIGVFAYQQHVAISICSNQSHRLRFINGSRAQALELHTASGTTRYT